MEQHTNQSAVARILDQIEAEYQSAHQALVGLAAGTARHAFITKKLEQAQGFHAALKPLVGERKATEIIVEVLEGWAEAPLL
jgi:hypothetical protein